jgi:iron complex outermembrane receptor protein
MLALSRRMPELRALSCSIIALVAAGVLTTYALPAFAADQSGDNSAKAPDAPELEVVVITATRGLAADIAPVKSSLEATQPQSTIDRTFIEDSVADTSDYTGTLTVSPSTSGIANNGPGLSEKDATLRGFGDGNYNVTYDGIPFGDTNDPSHHTTAYFPASTIGAVQVNRGPGEAGDLGQASLGGAIDLFSRTFSETPYAQQKVTYGSWNTRNLVTTLQSGKVEWLGNTRVTANFQELSSDGYLTNARTKEYNQFIKTETALNANWALTFLATHNSGQIHQPDNDGITLAQANTYGKNFSMSSNPALPTYYGYNTVKKETDFEYLRLNGMFGDGFALENTGYTYSYINHTYSATDTTQSANDILKNTYNSWGTKAGATGNKDVAGYDKLNAYRVWGDIARLSKNFSYGNVTGQLRGGFWYEIAETDRHRYDVDWTLGGVRNPIEKAPSGVSPAPDASVQFFERSSWKHYEPFLDIETHPIDGLTITPGVKYVSFTRDIAAPIGSKTRLPTYASATYTRTLPFLSLNYKIQDNLAVFAQYAQGFLIPPLKAFYVPDPKYNTIKPQTSTNYQIGTVYNSENVTFDADVYYVRAENAFQTGSVAVPGGGFEKIYYNDGTVDYKGVEAEGTYAFADGPLDGFSVFSNGSINDARGVTIGMSNYHKQIKNAPKWTAAFGIIYKMDNITLSLIDKFTGEQWASDGEAAAYKIPSYSVTNLVAGYDFGRFKLQAGIYNLFDDRSVTDITVNDGPTPTDPNSHDQFWWVPERSYQITLRATVD